MHLRIVEAFTRRACFEACGPVEISEQLREIDRSVGVSRSLGHVADAFEPLARFCSHFFHAIEQLGQIDVTALKLFRGRQEHRKRYGLRLCRHEARGQAGQRDLAPRHKMRALGKALGDRARMLFARLQAGRLFRFRTLGRQLRFRKDIFDRRVLVGPQPIDFGIVFDRPRRVPHPLVSEHHRIDILRVDIGNGHSAAEITTPLRWLPSRSTVSSFISSSRNPAGAEVRITKARARRDGSRPAYPGSSAVIPFTRKVSSPLKKPAMR